MINEIKEERRYSKNSISKHSIRKYECEGSYFYLDKTLDEDMPFYHLYVHHSEKFLRSFGLAKSGNNIKIQLALEFRLQLL